MNRNVLLRNLASVAVVATVGALRIGCAIEKCPHEGHDQTFTVQGNTCGPNGTVRVRSEKDSCDVSGEGAQRLGFPEFGRIEANAGPLPDGRWSLHEANLTLHLAPDGGVVPPDAGPSTTITGNRHCEATRTAGTLRLECIDRRSDLSGDEVGRCAATLTAN
ncbi:hypothetical protein [Myxococcus landrumensis]|uniref:Lipoprotein n=1 Tax=Myxococcus landrumensis TaxID=2813577 RepID=A0ABX7N2S6_9BACT|nr:hypothetical protein [Myxococcus landrumus]QSQ13025.1 hypothetical protein JY572_32465 [Myxococcus landrumus]